MTRIGLAALAALTLFALAPVAHADTLLYNASLVNPPGIYFGTGIANDGFTIDTNNNVELGLSAEDRFAGPITPTGNVYGVPLGGSSHGGSAWGIILSLNLQASGGALVLGGVDAVLSLTDTATGFHITIPDFLALVADNTCYGALGVDTACTNATDFGVQNAEPGSLMMSLGDTSFSDLAPDTYIITVAVYGCNTAGCESNLLATDTIELDTVPEPGTITLLGGALVALGALRGVGRRVSRAAA
jgi:hypothetical protein